MKKGFAPVLILVILLAVGAAAAAGLYLVNKNSPKTTTPTATNSAEANETEVDMSNWKTYTNTKNGFSFKYPVREKTEEFPIEQKGYLGLVVGRDLESFNPTFAVEVYTPEIDKDEMIGYESLYEKYLEAEKLSKLKIKETVKPTHLETELLIEECKIYIKTTEENLTNYTKSRFEKQSNECSAWDSPWSIFKKGSAFIIVKKFYMSTDEFDTMLSTFKFTDQKLSKDQAVEKVKNLPEVKDYISQSSNPVKVEYDHDDEDQDIYVIHVYEVLPDHVATFNWYDVNRTTGATTKWF